MRIKLIVFGAIVVVLVGAGVSAKRSRIWTQDLGNERRQDWQEQGRLAWYAQEAKKRGESEVVLDPPLVGYVTEIDSVDEVFDYYSVVVAKPIEKKTYVHDESNIVEWYKFNIIDTIHWKQCDSCPTPDNIPVEMLPLNASEILVPRIGGTASIEGVNVTVHNRRFPNFDSSKSYLLFLEVSRSGQVGKIMVGPDAVFSVDSEGKLTPINDKPHKLKKIITGSFDRSAVKLKEHVKKGKPAR